jgi:hypothetical protein
MVTPGGSKYYIPYNTNYHSTSSTRMPTIEEQKRTIEKAREEKIERLRKDIEIMKLELEKKKLARQLPGY